VHTLSHDTVSAGLLYNYSFNDFLKAHDCDGEKVLRISTVDIWLRGWLYIKRGWHTIKTYYYKAALV